MTKESLISAVDTHFPLFRLRARDCLLVAARRATSSLHLDTDSLILDFCGLGTFGGKVVFAELKGGEARERLTAVAGQPVIGCWG